MTHRDDRGAPGGLVRVGTRGSSLALRQTELIVGLLRDKYPGTEFVLKVIQTRGDTIQDRPISQIGDKGVFVRPIQQALLDGEIDLAVHSLKDVPSDEHVPGLQFSAFSRREDPRDVLISRVGAGLDDLPAGARLGTSSLRRRVQLHLLRPDLTFADIRGNVDTRLRKLAEEEYDALVLAAAGLHRLGLQERITQYLPPDQVVPDAGQGILGIQIRSDDPIHDLVRWLDDSRSRDAALAERAVVQALGADCRSPVGAHASVEEHRIELRAVASTEDGSRVERARELGPRHAAENLGQEVGARLRRLLA